MRIEARPRQRRFELGFEIRRQDVLDLLGVVVHMIHGQMQALGEIHLPQLVEAHDAARATVETMEALANERGEDGKIWGSMVKQALKRRKPGFNETYYGFRSFNDLLEEAEARNMLKLVPSESSGAYLVRMIDNDG